MYQNPQTQGVHPAIAMQNCGKVVNLTILLGYGHYEYKKLLTIQSF